VDYSILSCLIGNELRKFHTYYVTLTVIAASGDRAQGFFGEGRAQLETSAFSGILQS
jgi:hypothetical protein